jgi:DNA ligase-1
MLEFLNELASNSSRTFKEEKLTSLTGKALQDFQDIAVLTMSPSIDFFVRKYPRVESHKGSLSLMDAVQQLNNLSSRILTGNAAIHFLTALDEQLSEDDAEVLNRIISRDLKCGVSHKTINKIWPGLIYEHPYMRCSGLNQKSLAHIKKPCFSQTKEDGLYIDITVESGKVTYRTRNGSFIQLSDHTRDTYLAANANNYVLQGEALVIDPVTGEYLARTAGNGYLNSDSIDPSLVAFVLWDMVPLSDYKKKLCKVEYSNRLGALTKVIDNAPKESLLRLVDTKVIKSTEEIIAHFKEKLLAGKEGTVIKNMKGHWKPGTSKDQIKCKVEFDVELEVVGIKEGTGKNVGRLGALLCQSSDGKVQVSAGGGYKDEDRVKLYTEDMIGKIITVRSNDIVQNQSNLEVYSLFLPRFIEVRNDKTEADSYERIVEQHDSFVELLNAIKD